MCSSDLIENPETAAEIENKILAKLGIGEVGKAASAAAAAAAAAVPAIGIAPAADAAAKRPAKAGAAEPVEEAFPESIDDELVSRMASGE